MPTSSKNRAEERPIEAARLNLELKARDPDPERSLAVCRDLGAEDKGTLHQRDTYFEVLRGRLKLREERDAEAHLIAYERPDVRGTKESRYRIVAVADATGLKEALATVLGVRVVVVKVRRLFIFEGVRIHLDQVDGLGSFLELEGVVGERGDPRTVSLTLARLRQVLRIADADLLGAGYSDLLDEVVPDV